MLPVILPKRSKPTNPKIVAAVRQAQEFAQGRWGRLNPYWLQRAFIRVAWRGNAYRAQVCYSSTQGTSTTASFYS